MLGLPTLETDDISDYSSPGEKKNKPEKGLLVIHCTFSTSLFPCHASGCVTRIESFCSFDSRIPLVGRCLLIPKYFCAVYDYARKAGLLLARAIEIQKENWG